MALFSPFIEGKYGVICKTDAFISILPYKRFLVYISRCNTTLKMLVLGCVARSHHIAEASDFKQPWTITFGILSYEENENGS